MKKLYALLFVVCTFLALGSVSPLPDTAPFHDRLRYHSDKWELKLADPDQKVFRVDSERGKELLLSFIETRRNAVSFWASLSASLIAATLCVVGWIRENKYRDL